MSGLGPLLDALAPACLVLQLPFLEDSDWMYSELLNSQEYSYMLEYIDLCTTCVYRNLAPLFDQHMFVTLLYNSLYSGRLRAPTGL